jgi:hypothetical protein
VNPTYVGLGVFGSSFAGFLLGMWMQDFLPRHHLSAEPRDTVKVGIGLIATMTALILGLITASAKSSFDEVDRGVKKAAVDVLSLDRTLARYGPKTAGIRDGLKKAFAQRAEELWRPGHSKVGGVDPSSGDVSRVEGILDAIRGLDPHDDAQRALQSRALDLGEGLLTERWLVAGLEGASLPTPFLAVLLFWLTIIFASFGLFAPRNALVLVALLVCALSVGSAIFLVLELDSPFGGVAPSSRTCGRRRGPRGHSTG